MDNKKDDRFTAELDYSETEDNPGVTPRTIDFGSYINLQLEMFAKR